MADLFDKAGHVRSEIAKGNDGRHHCHWPGCDTLVTPAAWGCREHWYRLPGHLRDRIWRSYRVGQERTKTPSAAYVAVAREVQEWIKANAR